MLNISRQETANHMKTEGYTAFRKLDLHPANRMFRNFLLITMAVFLIMCFLPWTQNIQANGRITTLQPDQRPQALQSRIDGRVEQWFVREGQYVNKGDTLVFISDIKDEYFDPQLLERTEAQLVAKREAIISYNEKIEALGDLIGNLDREWKLKQQSLKAKIAQNTLKIASYEAKKVAAEIDRDIALRQLQREENMQERGIVSLTDLETKRMKKQETEAKFIDVDNQLEVLRNEQHILEIDLNNLDNEYGGKIAKARSDLFTTKSTMYDAEGEWNKMAIQLENYKRRRGFYYIEAPQSGVIAEASVSGIGETVKAGDNILYIIPDSMQLAVELFIDPVDFPLIRMGEIGRFIFDGWPAFIFSGWPGQSFGTFAGEIVAVDNAVNDKGKYRILLSEVPGMEPWPRALRIGSGAKGIILLNNVPVWYEIWRQLNGFPPDFYEVETNKKENSFKAPVKSLAK